MGTVTHRTQAGEWELCALSETCELLFHVPELTPAEVEALPQAMLEQLLEVADPPMRIYGRYGAGKYWEFEDPDSHVLFLDRGYDLPALILDSGRREWWVNGGRHRDGDKPAVVAEGMQLWCQHGLEHRDGDKPAQVLHSWYAETRKWMQHGHLKRSWRKPTIVTREHDTGYELHEWYRGTVTHRWLAPAVVKQTESGIEREWWLYGVKLWPEPFSVWPVRRYR